jgi:serine/threonine protein kinase
MSAHNIVLANSTIATCYRLLRPLGEGGMGTVYEAQHLRLGTRIAVKILSPQFAADPKFRDRFRREARAASQIRHPNVVQLIDFGETPNNSVFIAMELLEGHDLHHVLRTHAPTPMPWPRAQHLLAQAADALAAAHRCGIVHRDVKPSNVFVLEGAGVNDFVKLLDFGIAKIVAPTPTADSVLVKNLTATGEIFGTSRYMAPEQAYGTSNDPRVDIYSLGVVAYELLTGRVPFNGESNFEIATRHVYEKPRPIRELRPEIPAALEAVVLRALEKQPEDRFATMEDLGRALRMVTDAAAPPPSNARSNVPTATEVLAHANASMPSRRASDERSSIAATSAFQMPSAASPTQRTTHLPRAEASTGPLARHRSPVSDETGRDVALAGSVATTSMWRLMALAVLGAIAIGSLSATGVILAVSPEAEASPSVQEPAPLPGSQRLAAKAGPPDVLQPVVDAPAPEVTESPGEELEEQTDEPPEAVDDPVRSPDLGTTRPARRLASKPSTSSPPPKPKTDRELGNDIVAKVERKCRKLGVGKLVEVVLHVTADGHVDDQSIDATGELARCVEQTIGNPMFAARESGRTMLLRPTIGERGLERCNNPFEADSPECKSK